MSDTRSELSARYLPHVGTIRNPYLALARKFAIVGFALAAAAAGLLAYLGSSKPYEARASLLVVNPYASNPYLGVGRGQYAAAEVVQTELLSDPGIARLRSTGAMSAFSLELDQSISEPILLITATGPTASLATSTRNQLITAARSTLASSQREIGASPGTLFEFQEVDGTIGAEPIRHDAIQHGIEVCAATYVAFLLAVAARRSYREQNRLSKRSHDFARSSGPVGTNR